MIMILSTSGYIISEPKQLFCKWVDEGLSKEAIEKAPLRYKENKKGEEKARVSFEDAMKKRYVQVARGYIGIRYSYGRSAKIEEQIPKKCSENDWYTSYSFIFDTNDLKKPEKKQVALEWLESCGAKVRKIKEAFMTSSPTTLSISYSAYDYYKYPEVEEEREIFNIDRKTLKGGIKDSRIYDCKLSDLDTSENQI